MIQELMTYFLPVAKFILAAALLVVFYNLLYKEKTTFNHCRIYLLSIALVSLLLSQFNIVIYTPPARIVEVEAPERNSFKANTTEKMYEQPMNVVSIKAVEKPTFKVHLVSFFALKNILITFYLLVTIGLLVSLIIQLFQILAAKRKGSVKVRDGYEMVVSPVIPTPFSFFKSIYIGENLTGNKLEMILKHEQWHIKHQHYLDVLVMEILVRIFWFNPVLWWVRKELRNVSEFQVDRSVLDEGHDLYQYQTLILEEVMERNPYLANGFNNSFTKKRFIMMKNKFQLRMTTLRRVLILPFLVTVFSMLSFSVGKSQVKYVTKASNGNTTVKKAVEIDRVHVNNSSLTIDSTNTVGETIDTSVKIGAKNDRNQTIRELQRNLSHEASLNRQMNYYSIGLSHAIVELNNLVKNPEISNRNIGIKKVCSSVFDVFGDCKFGDEFCGLITQDQLMKSAENFSKIKAKFDELIEEENIKTKELGYNQQMGMMFRDSLISKAFEYKRRTTVTEKVSKNIPQSEDVSDAKVNVTNVDPYAEAMKNAYRLKPEQIVVLDIPYSDMTIYSIEKSKQETKITLATPIIAGDYWVKFPRNFQIIDLQTKDIYMIRKLENNIPLSEFIFAPNTRRKMIAITMIFPPLKGSVKKVNIMSFVEPGVYLPSNSSSPYQFKNIIIKDYQVPVSSVHNIYR